MEPIVPVPSPPVVRDASGRFTAGSGRPVRRRRGGGIGNLNAVKNPWVTFWTRRALRPQDKWILPLLSDYSAALMAQRGGPEIVTAALRFTIELAALARGCVMLILAQSAGAGGIVGTRRGVTVKGADATKSLADPDLAAALARFMALEANALRTIGMEPVAKPVKSLREVLMEAARETETAPASSSAAVAAQAGSGAAEGDVDE